MLGWLQRWVEDAMKSQKWMQAAMLHWQRERETAASRRAEQRRRVRPQLEVLGTRIVPAVNTDTIIWEPQNGDNNGLASDPTNWWDASFNNGQGTRFDNVVGANGTPTAGNTIWLGTGINGHGDNLAITWDKNTVGTKTRLATPSPLPTWF